MKPALLGQSAAAIAQVIKRDPQFDLPERPRLCEGLVIVPLEAGLLIEGGAERQVFRGAAAKSLVPRLLPLLDGDRSCAELAGELDLSTAQVVQAVSLLYSCGVIEQGEDERRPSSAVGAFLSRSVDSTRIHRSGGAAQQALEAARVELRGMPACTRRIQAILKATGIANVGENVQRPTLVMFALDSDACETKFIQYVRTAAVAVLPVRLFEEHVEVGPLLGPGLPSCASCLARARGGARFAIPEPAQLDLAASLAAAEAVHLLSGIGSLPSLHGAVALPFETLQAVVMAVPRERGCPQCGTSSLGIETSGESLAGSYERMVAFPPRQYLSVKAHQRHFLPSNRLLQRVHRSFPNAPRGGLQSFDLANMLSPRAYQPFDDVICALLQLGFGFRAPAAAGGAGTLRWVANAANMGSPQARIALRRGVGALARGVYAYEPVENVLCRLPAEPDVLYDAIPEAADSPALLVMTGALERLRKKYDSLAFRMLFLDAGCVLAQLRSCAAAMGLELSTALHWNDIAIEGVLDLQAEVEPITAVGWFATHSEAP